MKQSSIIIVLLFAELVLCSCSKYSSEEQAVVDAYNASHNALTKGDFEAVKKTLTRERIKGIEDMMAKSNKGFNDVMESIKQYVPQEVRIVKITKMDTNGVFLNLETTKDGKTIQGNSFLKKEGGAWKVDNENWFWQGIKK